MKLYQLIGRVFCAAMILTAVSNAADIPHEINYQGRLTDNGGTALDGDYNIQFTIYDQESGGTNLWQEQHLDIDGNAITVQSGLFNVVLGSITPIPSSVFDAPDRWLGIKIGADPEIAPRTKLLSIPYAYRALTVDNVATGGGWTDDGTIIRLNNTDDSVGIGTDTPGAKLHISQTTSGSYEVKKGMVAEMTNNGDGIESKGLEVVVNNTGTDGEAIGIYGDAGGNDTYKVAIDGYSHDGGFMIGVRGSAQSNGSSNGKYGLYGQATGAGNQNVGVFAEASGGTKNFAGLFNQGDVNIRFGGLGIGIDMNTPAAKLQIGGTPGVDGIMFPDGTVQTSAASGDADWVITGSDMESGVSGNVGIGTSSPVGKLGVVSSSSNDYSEISGIHSIASVSGLYGTAFGILGRAEGTGTEIGPLTGVAGEAIADGSTTNDLATGVSGRAIATSGDAGELIGLYGEADGTASTASINTYGLIANALSNTAGGSSWGIRTTSGTGITSPTTSYGVESDATASGPNAYAYGLRATGSASGSNSHSYGLWARAAGDAPNKIGVYSIVTSDAGTKYGLYTRVDHSGDVNYGVYSEAHDATENWAGYFIGDMEITGNTGIGIEPPSHRLHVSDNSYADYTEHIALKSEAVNNSNYGGSSIAIYGTTSSGGIDNVASIGVIGEADADNGTSGSFIGSVGVKGIGTANGDIEPSSVGLYGEALVTGNTDPISYGVTSHANANGNGGISYGIESFASIGSGQGTVCYGSYASSFTTTSYATNVSYGSYNRTWGGAPTMYGVYAAASALPTGTNESYGIYAKASGATTNWAGYFEGDVNVTGDIYGANKYFRIDHPLDPANKYLQHSAVESPEMSCVYNGNVILDVNGEAIVQMPEYLEALVENFRYQLTCVGGYAPIYIAEEFSNNQFKIAGGKPGMKVSWQVTGTRKDAYARANPMAVELNKQTSEVGKYIHPEALGLSEELGVNYEQNKKREEQQIEREQNRDKK